MNKDDLTVVLVFVGCFGIPLYIWITVEMTLWCIRRRLGSNVIINNQTVPPLQLFAWVVVCALASIVAMPIGLLAVPLIFCGALLYLMAWICFDCSRDYWNGGDVDVENPQTCCSNEARNGNIP